MAKRLDRRNKSINAVFPDIDGMASAQETMNVTLAQPIELIEVDQEIQDQSLKAEKTETIVVID